MEIYRHLYIFTAIVKYLIRVKYQSHCCVPKDTFQAKKISGYFSYQKILGNIFKTVLLVY